MVPYHERIADDIFRKAVEMIDSGDVQHLKAYLLQNPSIIFQRISFDETGYFSNPCLLEFTAENPIRHGKLPDNITGIVKIILDAGAKADGVQLNSTLGLVSSGKVARECGVQIPLINLLCGYGANPDQAILSALTHGEFEAVAALIENGAKINLPVAAAKGDINDFQKLFRESVSAERHLAVALAAQYGRVEILKFLLENGEKADRYNPPGAHSHSTPLHQAVFTANLQIVTLLVEAGARLDIKDKIFNGTPLDWAVYGKFAEIENYLRSVKNI